MTPNTNARVNFSHILVYTRSALVEQATPTSTVLVDEVPVVRDISFPAACINSSYLEGFCATFFQTTSVPTMMLITFGALTLQLLELPGKASSPIPGFSSITRSELAHFPRLVHLLKSCRIQKEEGKVEAQSGLKGFTICTGTKALVAPSQVHKALTFLGNNNMVLA